MIVLLSRRIGLADLPSNAGIDDSHTTSQTNVSDEQKVCLHAVNFERRISRFNLHEQMQYSKTSPSGRRYRESIQRTCF